MVEKRTKGLRKGKGGVVIHAADSHVPVEWADGEIRSIKFTMRAIAAIENCYPERDAEGHLTGNPATPIGVILSWTKPETGMPWSQLETFLWAGLLYEYPDMTKDEMSDWFDLSKINYYDEKVGEAIRLTIGARDGAAQEAEAIPIKNGELTGTS